MNSFGIRGGGVSSGDLRNPSFSPLSAGGGRSASLGSGRKPRRHGCWVAVKELKLSYYIGETLLFTIYTHYGNLNPKPYITL